MIPAASHYWLKNAHIPRALICSTSSPLPEPEGIAALDNLALVDLEIQDGVIRSLYPADSVNSGELPFVDLKRGLLWCCFADLHTHLDKGHIWGRSPNRSGTFEEALTLVRKDSEQHWDAEDVYRRMEFSLKCAYAHGTKAIRTHLDSLGEQAEISFGVFQTLQKEWADRISLQAVSLVPLEIFLEAEGEKLANLVADTDNVLGGLSLMTETLDAALDRIFTLAKERHLDLDFHVDESGSTDMITLRHIAQAALRHEFSGQIVCGHCCSLGVQSPTEVMKSLDLVKQAGIGIVSLPMCNLYLQDRNQVASWGWLKGNTSPQESAFSAYPDSFSSLTPRWRGTTLLHELKHYGIPVAIASDNCRDPFHGFGDLDGLEVLAQSTRIAHLDAPYGDWSKVITTTPADLMKLPDVGRIGVGLPADLILFKARYFSELFARPQSDRIVLRRGRPIDTTLPDYAELDDLLEGRSIS